ncbi:MAG: hypothetical protein MHM6MM_007264, partial [Cercozoa sp. M6MM]
DNNAFTTATPRNCSSRLRRQLSSGETRLNKISCSDSTRTCNSGRNAAKCWLIASVLLGGSTAFVPELVLPPFFQFGWSKLKLNAYFAIISHPL